MLHPHSSPPLRYSRLRLIAEQPINLKIISLSPEHPPNREACLNQFGRLHHHEGKRIIMHRVQIVQSDRASSFQGGRRRRVRTGERLIGSRRCWKSIELVELSTNGRTIGQRVTHETSLHRTLHAHDCSTSTSQTSKSGIEDHIWSCLPPITARNREAIISVEGIVSSHVLPEDGWSSDQ